MEDSSADGEYYLPGQNFNFFLLDWVQGVFKWKGPWDYLPMAFQLGHRLAHVCFLVSASRSESATRPTLGGEAATEAQFPSLFGPSPMLLDPVLVSAAAT